MNKEALSRIVNNNIPLRLQELAESTDALEELGFDTDNFVLLPKDYKDRVRYFGNLLAQMSNATVFQKDERLMIELRRLSQTLSYLLNSQSLTDDKMHDFDQAEINRKLLRNF